MTTIDVSNFSYKKPFNPRIKGWQKKKVLKREVWLVKEGKRNFFKAKESLRREELTQKKSRLGHLVIKFGSREEGFVFFEWS